MLFKFEYNGEIVLEGISNELSSDVTITSGGNSDDVQYEVSGEAVTSWVNSGNIIPASATQDFTRLSTEMTIGDDYVGEYIYSEHHKIRLSFSLTHNGTQHNVYLRSFEKYCGVEDEVEIWQRLWNNQGSIALSWDSSQEEGYFCIYHGIVNDKYGQSGGVESIGFQFRTRRAGVFENSSNTIFWQDNVFNPAPEPEQTYPPTSGNVHIGGTGNGFYPSDPAERPDIDTLNAILSFGSSNGKGLTYYSAHGVAEIYEVFAKIYSNSFINLETRLKAMVDAFRIPFANTESGAVGQQMNNIPVADVSVHLENFGMYPILKRYVQVDFGVLDMSQYGWDDWNDFSNTTATLYLPFHGRINIDVNAFIRGSIEIIAVCDTYTGNVSYWVYTKPMQAEREYLYGVYEGQSAVQIPVASTYTPNLMGKIMSNAGILGGGIVAAATGHPIAAGIAGASMLATAPTALEQSIDTSHMLDSASNATSPLHVRLDISRREMLRPEQYREIASIPAFVTERFGDLEGFVRVHSADYSGLKCEQPEKEVIKQMLEDGVYL